MRQRIIATILQVLGAGLVAFGAGLVFLPAGIIIAGVFVLAFAIAIERP